MPKTTRRTLGFDSLEGKVLLSTGMADPAATVHRATTQGLYLKGVLTGVSNPNGPPNGVGTSTFTVKGSAGSMGTVKGSLTLAKPLTPGGKPDLSAGALTLANRQGRVQLSIGTSSAKYYQYVITSGTGSFASASGSGVIALHFSRKLYNSVIIVLHSHPH